MTTILLTVALAGVAMLWLCRELVLLSSRRIDQLERTLCEEQLEAKIAALSKHPGVTPRPRPELVKFAGRVRAIGEAARLAGVPIVTDDSVAPGVVELRDGDKVVSEIREAAKHAEARARREGQ